MEEFNNINELKEYIKLNGTTDYIKLKNIIYTMDLYDFKGETITYGNKRTSKGLILETSNRYGINKFNDVNIEEIENVSLRNDIAYLD